MQCSLYRAWECQLFKIFLRGQRWCHKHHHKLDLKEPCKHLLIMDSLRKSSHQSLLVFLQSKRKVYRYLSFKHRTLMECFTQKLKFSRQLKSRNDADHFHFNLCKSYLLHSSKEFTLKHFHHVHFKVVLCLAYQSICLFDWREKKYIVNLQPFQYFTQLLCYRFLLNGWW